MNAVFSEAAAETVSCGFALRWDDGEVSSDPQPASSDEAGEKHERGGACRDHSQFVTTQPRGGAVTGCGCGRRVCGIASAATIASPAATAATMNASV